MQGNRCGVVCVRVALASDRRSRVVAQLSMSKISIPCIEIGLQTYAPIMVVACANAAKLHPFWYKMAQTCHLGCIYSLPLLYQWPI